MERDIMPMQKEDCTGISSFLLEANIIIVLEMQVLYKEKNTRLKVFFIHSIKME